MVAYFVFLVHFPCSVADAAPATLDDGVGVQSFEHKERTWWSGLIPVEPKTNLDAPNDLTQANNLYN